MLDQKSDTGTTLAILLFLNHFLCNVSLSFLLQISNKAQENTFCLHSNLIPTDAPSTLQLHKVLGHQMAIWLRQTPGINER